MTATCATCPRPVPGQEYGCAHCAKVTADRLAAIAELAAAARDVAARQTRRGPAVGGTGGGSRLPLNLAAAARLDVVGATITTWARHVAETRGVPVGASSVHGAGRTGPGEYPGMGRTLTGHLSGSLEAAARHLAGQTEWARHRQEWGELYADVAAAERVLRGVVDGPPPRRWLGQCGAPGETGPCRLDITATPGKDTARCRCGATVVVTDRLAELAQLVRGYSYTASEIAEAYPEIRANAIRVWASRGRILATGEVDGRPTYDLGEVLDRARDELRRRAEREARRASFDHAGTQGVTSRDSSGRSVEIAGSAA